MTQYYGMVKCIDDNVGKILQALKSNDLLEHTIVVFTADHGDLCGEHKKLNKGVPYEGSAKIPFIMYYPEKIRPGTVVAKALSCVDFLPTVLSLMNVRTAGKEEGRDASALLMGKTPPDWKDIAFLRGTRNWLCAVTDSHKIVYATEGVPWLFDLSKDPDELTNLYRQPQYRGVVRDLTAELLAYCKKYNDPRGEDAKIKGQMAAALR